MFPKSFVCLLAAVVSNVCLAQAQETPDLGPLRTYVKTPDEAYKAEAVSETTIGLCKAHVLRLTSQKWQGIEWWHWLSVLVPPEVDDSNGAILVITGGSNKRKNPPGGGSREAMMLSAFAAQSRSVLAILQQVPNQPLFGNLYEDHLIAHTFDKYLSGGDDTWPLLLPMVKSAVKAMDAVQALSKEKLGRAVEKFVVTGASKRGWTTWLTGASDERVSAIAPMVIDMLNTEPQMELQLKTYGKFSEMIKPYTERKIQERMDTERGKLLTEITDPYAYRESLKMPKLILLGTNDPYWTVDAARQYYPGLEGPKSLFYLPNAGHGLGLGILPTITTFFRNALDEKPMPELDWKRSGDGKTLKVNWQQENAQARVWMAQSGNRDFRKAKWVSKPATGTAGSCEVELRQPVEGWVAYAVEVIFPGEDKSKQSPKLSTEIFVVPDTYPHEANLSE